MRLYLSQIVIIAICVSTVACFINPQDAFVKIPKEQRMEGMAEQEFEMTKDLCSRQENDGFKRLR